MPNSGSIKSTLMSRSDLSDGRRKSAVPSKLRWAAEPNLRVWRRTRRIRWLAGRTSPSLPRMSSPVLRDPERPVRRAAVAWAPAL